jgi:hypothetical protein
MPLMLETASSTRFIFHRYSANCRTRDIRSFGIRAGHTILEPAIPGAHRICPARPSRTGPATPPQSSHCGGVPRYSTATRCVGVGYGSLTPQDTCNGRDG